MSSGNAGDKSRRMMSASNHSKRPYDPIGLFSVMRNSRAFFALLQIMFSMILFGFPDTILADKLQKDFGLEDSIVSCIYASGCFGFLLTSAFPHKLLDLYNSIEIMMVAMFFQLIGCFMLGPSEILHFPNSLFLVVPGQIIMGMSIPFTIVSAYQELYDAVIMTGKHFEPNALNDVLVALFNTFFSLGLTIGPLCGAYITIATDFRFTCDIYALILLGFMVLYFSVIYLPMRIKKQPFKPVKKCFSLTSSQ